LLPHCGAADVGKAHLLSSLLLLNEKLRERLPAWDCFPDAENFRHFFKR
jgi:hypothetical protein